MGKLLNVSDKTHKKLFRIKKKEQFKSVDTVIRFLIRECDYDD